MQARLNGCRQVRILSLRELQRVAQVRWTKVLGTGKTVSWEDAKGYLRAQAVDGRAHKPAARMVRPSLPRNPEADH